MGCLSFRIVSWLIVVSLGLATNHVWADDAAPAKGTTDAKSGSAVAAGHSAHGEVFDEGPRQRAYLMGNTGPIVFPITTKAPEAQQFFLQGVGQLHGFWYFEAERSFRQVAALDPNCVMAYWGMAQANISNEKRAAGFIAKAVEHKQGASRYESLWIDALRAYLPEKKASEKKDANAKSAETQRRRKLVRDLEAIIHEFPDDLEARAFLVKHIWLNSQEGLPISSHQAVEALIGEVLAKQPLHPIHHYRIHLWDNEKPARALPSAALCGQSAPNIAHMWHMPGHIFSGLKRYDDAAWQQEASSRVDHAHMIHDRVLPDQIHNYAHNQDWLAKNLTYIGRVHDAVDLAKNLIELPRHPKYNTFPSKGSSKFGRSRLIDTLARFELWDELIALCDTRYIEPTDLPAEQVRRLRALGAAWFGKGDLQRGEEQIARLDEMLAAIKTEQIAAAEKAETSARERKDSDEKVKKAAEDAKRPFNDRMKPIETALAELAGHRAVAKSEWSVAWEKFKAANVSNDVLSRARLQAGDKADAERLAREAVQSGPSEVYPLANQADVLYRLGKTAEAKEAFQKLRALSAQFDLDVPVFARLQPLAKELGLPDDWRQAKPTPTDAGVRPELASLGPFRWHPSPAPEWKLPTANGQAVSLAEYRGRPLVVIFYLGFGCLHCVEQLKTFCPLAKDYEAAGISLLAISSDDIAGLQRSLEPGDPEITFPLVSDATLEVFKAYRAYDDFEQSPLHATFLIDGAGLVRWQDISFEPFTDAKFLLAESRRLLGSDTPTPAPSAPVTGGSE